MVPKDFGNTINKDHWKIWGDKNIPHVTLTEYFDIDFETLKKIVNQIAKSSPLKKSRWSFSKKRKYKIIGKNSGNLRILYFDSYTLMEKLKKYIPNKMKDELHITLGILR